MERLPEGLDHDVRERGATLSVGQRQLIAFVRAYLSNPHILILDEATSSIDSESEQYSDDSRRDSKESESAIRPKEKAATAKPRAPVASNNRGRNYVCSGIQHFVLCPVG